MHAIEALCKSIACEQLGVSSRRFLLRKFCPIPSMTCNDIQDNSSSSTLSRSSDEPQVRVRHRYRVRDRLLFGVENTPSRAEGRRGEGKCRCGWFTGLWAKAPAWGFWGGL
jgi:hypothetical protein